MACFGLIWFYMQFDFDFGFGFVSFRLYIYTRIGRFCFREQKHIIGRMKTPPDPGIYEYYLRVVCCVSCCVSFRSFLLFYLTLDLILFILFWFCFGCYIYTHIGRFLFSSKKDNISRIARYKKHHRSSLLCVSLAVRYVSFVFFFVSVGVEFFHFLVFVSFSA